MDESLRADLEAVASARIFFGHQSVGHDIMAGVADLDSAAGVRALSIVTVGREPLQGGGVFAHRPIGENGDPAGKCEDFARVLDRYAADTIDIAILKFCYADIRHTRNIEEMFDSYKRSMDSLRSRYPSVTFVHVTVPVTMRSDWWKRVGRMAMGKDDEWDMGSTNRYLFNQRMLATYGNEPFFDLAAVESTRPDGTRDSFTYRGKQGLALLPEYTYDGGHLNERGRRVVAREFIRVIAGVVRSRGKL
jgi:hypothetical protein